MSKPDKKTKGTKHQRVNQSITSSLEKRVLLWFAANMPGCISPDLLSLIGFLAAVLIGISYVLSKNQPVFLWIACLGFVLNWFGDSMDGTLARYRKIERPRYGYFLDHSIDVISLTVILTGLGFSGYSRLELAWAVNVLYLLLTLYTTLVNFTSNQFQISFGLLGPTEIRILAIIASIWVYFDGSKFIRLPFGDFTFYEAILLSLVFIFLPVYLISTTSQIITLYREDPPHFKK